MSDTKLDADKEFIRIRQERVQHRSMWDAISRECTVRVSGQGFNPSMPRCAGVISNLDGDRLHMRYCLYDCCPKIY